MMHYQQVVGLLLRLFKKEHLGFLVSNPRGATEKPLREWLLNTKIVVHIINAEKGAVMFEMSAMAGKPTIGLNRMALTTESHIIG